LVKEGIEGGAAINNIVAVKDMDHWKYFILKFGKIVVVLLAPSSSG
jgi:hypothetical protein